MMNKIKMSSITVLVVILSLTVGTTALAQESNLPEGHPKIEKESFHKGPCIPDLTDKQEEQMEAIHLLLMKESLPIKNQIGEKEARLKTLKTADKAELAKINLVIDDIAKLKAELAKKHAAKEQEIRKILTEKQRLFFDTHGPHIGRGHGMKEHGEKGHGMKGLRKMKHHKKMCSEEQACKEKKHCKKY